MAVKENGKVKRASKMVLPADVKRAKLEISSVNGDGTTKTAFIAVAVPVAKSIIANAGAKKSIRKSERGGPADLLVVKLSA